MPFPVPPSYDEHTPLFLLLQDARAIAAVETALPGFTTGVEHTGFFGTPIGLLYDTESSRPTTLEGRRDLMAALAALDPARRPAREHPAPPSAPSSDYEGDDVAPATLHAPETVRRFERIELRLDGPRHGNPFVDVELSARVATPDGGEVRVPGFYDGDGTYLLRFLPETEGEHRFVTTSTARSLDGIPGSFRVLPAAEGAHGPVRVADTFHFAHADGTPFRPVGTTLYAWTHQPSAIEDQTLAELRDAPFTKVRMGIFPKSYLHNAEEPERFPFEGSAADGFDLQRFDPDFWHHLERRIDDLAALDIEADVILFHPYDRWGFATMAPDADDRYLRYAIARLAAFPNVWWSLANEYDLLAEKSLDDWERFAGIVAEEDPSAHLLSIHNCFTIYDYDRPWATHASIQRTESYRTTENVTEWRARWGKPVVVVEFGYEGDVDAHWGDLTAEEMTRKFWEAALRGAYATHGETFLDPDEVIWWAKGGRLKGESPARIRFLERILAEAPGRLEPLGSLEDVRAGVGDHVIQYFGTGRPGLKRFVRDPASPVEVDVIDTWAMTVTTLPGTRSGRFDVELPARPYLAIRLRAAP